jgi:phosphoglycolate phosphatase
VDKLLEALEARGLRWGVVTNKPHRFTVPVMQGLGLMQRSGTTISGDTTAHAKPHPLPLLTAAAELGVPPSSVLYVGDDLRDIQAAQAAGMPSAAAGWGYIGHNGEVEAWGADVIADTPLELLLTLP